MSKITIVQDAVDEESIEGNVISIYELIENASAQRIDEVYGRLSRVELEPIAGVNLYKILWPRFAIPSVYEDSRMSISLQLILYEQLATRINEGGITHINCKEVDDFYLPAILDLANSQGISVKYEDNALKLNRLRGFIYGFTKLLLVIIDGLLTYVLYSLRSNYRQSDVIFVPHLNRFGSLRPVIDAADFNYQIIAPIASVEWLRARVTNKWPDVVKYDPNPIAIFGTIQASKNAMQNAIALLKAEIFHNRFHNELADAVEEEFGYRFDHVIDNSLSRVYRVHLSSLPNYWYTKSMIKNTQCKAIVVGSQSLRQQSILLAADSEGVKTYHVPHTAPLHHEAVPRTSTTHFVPCETSRGYLEESPYVPSRNQIVTMGRPLLANLSSQRKVKEQNDEYFRILVPTQPFNNTIRREFISDVLMGINESDLKIKVVIKPHPFENNEFYSDLVSNSDDRVRVIEGDIYEQIKTADLMVYITTNAGLESIALGTPCVSINHWEPWIFSRPHQDALPIPILRSKDEVSSFFKNLETSQIMELRDTQLQRFDEEYLIESDVGAAIAEYISKDFRTDSVAA